MPLRIAIVGPLPPPSGGMANQTRQLERLLASDGYEVSVVRTNQDYRPRWVGRLPGVRALFRSVPYLANLWRVIGRSDMAHVMANSGLAWHLFAAPAILIARLRRVAVIVNYRGGFAEAFLRRSAWLVRPTLHLADALIVPSRFLESVFARYGITAEVVPNVVDLSRFSPGERTERDPHLVVARNLEAIYDVPTAVRAFAIVRQSIPGVRLTVAGTGPARREVEQVIAELGLSACVRLVGNLEAAEMAQLLREADLMLNASTVDNMPNALLEAMASGLPIVTSDVGGIPFFTENERTAMHVPPRAPDVMAQAALRVLTDKGLRERLRTAGLSAAGQFEWRQVGPRLAGVYERASRRIGQGVRAP